MPVSKNCFICLAKPFIRLTQIFGYPLLLNCNHNGNYTYTVKITKYQIAWSIFYVTLMLLQLTFSISRCLHGETRDVVPIFMHLIHTMTAFNGLVAVLAVMLNVKAVAKFIENMLKLQNSEFYLPFETTKRSFYLEFKLYTYCVILLPICHLFFAYFSTIGWIENWLNCLSAILTVILSLLGATTPAFHRLILTDGYTHLIDTLKRRLQTTGNISNVLMEFMAFRGDVYVSVKSFNKITYYGTAAHLLTQMTTSFCIVYMFTWKVINGDSWSSDEASMVHIVIVGYSFAALACAKGDLLSTVDNVMDSFLYKYPTTKLRRDEIFLIECLQMNILKQQLKFGSDELALVNWKLFVNIVHYGITYVITLLQMT